jgi:hypothetical protein
MIILHSGFKVAFDALYTEHYQKDDIEENFFRSY